ncbi:DUF397 domain-containing protein [Streptomyces sp. NPDC057654]|uniref:DUF397 domain-containing protein n=1 Tax=Streptomyces sp. NPDC057654 TaxID=3346196 RepID=UPI0036BBABA8
MHKLDLQRANWRKSTYSNGSQSCVEVADGFSGIVPVRDSKNSDGPALVLNGTAWSDFVAFVRTTNV